MLRLLGGSSSPRFQKFVSEQRAQFNAGELQRLESLEASKADGEAFAKRGKLVPQAVP